MAGAIRKIAHITIRSIERDLISKSAVIAGRPPPWSISTAGVFIQPRILSREKRIYDWKAFPEPAIIPLEAPPRPRSHIQRRIN